MLSANANFDSNESPENSNFEFLADICLTRSLDLSCIELGVYDKLYAAAVFERQLNDPNPLSLRAFAEKHNVASSTFSDWYQKYKKFKETGELQMCGKRGNQSLFDEASIEKLQKGIIERKRGQKCLNKSELLTLMVNLANETRANRGYAPSVVDISEKSVRKYKKVADIGEGKIQHKTHARIVAEADPRNALSMHALVVAFCKDLYPAMIGNFDATQFKITQEAPDKGFYIKQERVESDDKPITAESNGRLDFAVKFYHVNNALGYTAIPVYCIAVPEMTETQFEYHKIHGLGTNREQSNYGYVCFTKTRACNKAFYAWLAEHILVPFVNESREAHDCKVRNRLN